MKDIKPDFSRFGTRFQESLVSLIIKDRPFSDQIKEVLDINYLEVKQLQFVLKEMYDYKQKYKIHPSTDALLVLLNEKKREHETIPAYEKAIEFVTSVAETKDIPDENFIKETALNFCKKQALADAIFKSVDLLDKSSYDEIQKLINDAMKLGVSQDSGHDFHKDFEARYLSSQRRYIETPWPEINNITQGGFGRGELNIVISNTGGGKSHNIIHFGAHALKQGFSGVHYTLELKDVATTRRYDSCISGIDINVANQNKHFIKEAVEECPGELLVREWPTKSASVNTIRAHLDKIIGNGFKPDFVIVDYADLLKNISKSSEKRQQLEEVNEELRGIAQAYNVVMVTCSQANRSKLQGNSAGDSDMITMESINESYGKCFPADFIWTLSRNKKDKDSGTGKFFIAKNRNGPDGMVFKVLADTSTSTFRILPSDQADNSSLTGSRDHDSVGNVLNTAPSGSAQRIYQRHKENRT